MRPLILTPLYPPAVGGAATYFADLVPGLLARPEIDHIFLLSERLPGEPEYRGQGKLGLLRLMPARIGMARRPWLWHAASYLHTQRWLRYWLPRLVKQHQIDFIHFHTRYRGRLFYQALRRCGVPVLADLRDKLSNPAQLARASQRLLCCAQGVQRFAIEGGYPAQRTDLVPVTFRQPSPPTAAQLAEVRQQFQLGDRPLLLYVGDVNASKGIFQLLQAFARWQQRHEDVTLVIAGPNRLGRPFLAQASRIPRVRYLGQVAHAQAIALMAAAELLILPSLSEGLPTVILEAVALGTRVICPPAVPEFETYLPQFTLSSVDPETIERMLDQVWTAPERPDYPLQMHQLDQIVDGVCQVYTRLLS